MPSVPVHLPEDPLRDLIDDNFMQYASYVIRDRAIPQLEDGLKPVQRRILHALYEKDDGRFNKVANIVGHCMQYHPHGDVSIEDALVNLVNKSYLIEGQGNFGNIFTGDPAAASRYIECRLTELARNELFNPDLTEYVPSYDGRNREPVVLPSKLPILLMLGAEGIAVGLSTRILPHNFTELLKAQIAVLEGRRFKLNPDFPQGGLMDASDYNRGNGKVRLRAKIEQDQGRLVIREIPAGTTTESVIASIEEAVRKRKLRVRAINDFTAAQVEIVITLAPGEDPEKVVAALYHFTQCELTLQANLVVIRGERPVQMDVDEVIRFNTEQLTILLRRELELKRAALEAEHFRKTLIQIFVENRVYRKIEDSLTSEEVQRSVFHGLRPFAGQLPREITNEDVDMLLDLPIKRISRFDRVKNEKERAAVLREIELVKTNLRRVTGYTIDYLKRLLETYGKKYRRKTQLTTTEEIDVRELTANELAIVYDRERGLIGSTVKGEAAFRCSPLDRLLIVWDDGRYQIMPPPERLFVDRNLAYLGIYQRDLCLMMIYSTSRGGFIKRFAIGGAIMNRDYSCVPEGGKIKFLTDRPVSEVRLKYRHIKGARLDGQTFDPGQFGMRGPRSRGNQVTKRIVTSVVAR